MKSLQKDKEMNTTGTWALICRGQLGLLQHPATVDFKYGCLSIVLLVSVPNLPLSWQL